MGQSGEGCVSSPLQRCRVSLGGQGCSVEPQGLSWRWTLVLFVAAGIHMWKFKGDELGWEKLANPPPHGRRLELMSFEVPSSPNRWDSMILDENPKGKNILYMC